MAIPVAHVDVVQYSESVSMQVLALRALRSYWRAMRQWGYSK